MDFLIETQRVHTTDKDDTAEDRAKISAVLKKRWEDAEYRVKQIATHTGRHPSVETMSRAKLSESIKRWYNRKGNRGWKEVWL